MTRGKVPQLEKCSYQRISDVKYADNDKSVIDQYS